MDQLYASLRALHIGAVAASGLLFAFRGLALNVLGVTWTRALPLRVLSWCIDTVLLGAAIALTTIVDQYPFVNGWLTAKVLLLVVYIGLGTVALRPQRRRSVRLAALVLAFAVFGFIVTIARAHDPAGLFAA